MMLWTTTTALLAAMTGMTMTGSSTVSSTAGKKNTAAAMDSRDQAILRAKSEQYQKEPLWSPPSRLRPMLTATQNHLIVQPEVRLSQPAAITTSMSLVVSEPTPTTAPQALKMK